MAGSSFGTLYKLTTFGESHGVAIGGVVDGVPPGFILDINGIQEELDRRKPGQSAITTQRNESDQVELLSGIFEGKTTGTPIGFIIKNKDARSKDYDQLKNVYRPSHADYTYEKKYGIRDYRGGGRSSARETACRIVAGAIAKQILRELEINIVAYVDQIGVVKLQGEIDFREIDGNPVRCPNASDAKRMLDLIETVRDEGDSIGGSIKCEIANLPVGLGEPVFDKLHAELGKAVLSINAVKGVEFGSGFDAIEMRGSEHNDEFINGGATRTNYSGGVQGGISNGMPIVFRTAFKPVATISKTQSTIDKNGNVVELKAEGRHDPCVVPRAVPIVEAMAAIVILDMYLWQNAINLKCN